MASNTIRAILYLERILARVTVGLVSSITAFLVFFYKSVELHNRADSEQYLRLPIFEIDELPKFGHNNRMVLVTFQFMRAVVHHLGRITQVGSERRGQLHLVNHHLDFVFQFLSSEYITLSRLGADLEGSPLSYLHFGHLDTRGMLKSAKYHDIQEYVVHYLETDLQVMKKYTEKTGHFVDRAVFIFNFDCFSLTSATHKQTLETFLDLLRMYEANYPETLKRAYVINVSYYFFLMWAVLKPFLSPETVNKIQIYGKTGWQEQLLKSIDPDVVPKFLGGNRTDPDGNPMCKTLIRLGGIVPESFFEYANQSCSARLPGAKKLIVSRISKSEVTLHVLHPGSTLEWEFVVKHGNIGFSVLYRQDTEDKEVITQQRTDTSQSAESGMYQCQKSGKYILVFDNTFSWVHAKEVYYTAAVVMPEKQLS